MVSRRGFIRVLGTSAVILAAGGVGLTQCDPMPDAAIEAWKGPAPNIKDPRVRALSFALLAPNPHNMQPWIADLREPGVITFFCDRSRLLPASDPYARQITVGCGAFLEMLRMAAAEQGFRADIAAFPQGDWPENAVGDQPVCRVAFVADQTVQRDPLLAQALMRRTNRGSFDNSPVARGDAEAIGAAMYARARYGWTAEEDAMTRLRDIAKRAWTIEVGADGPYYESVKVYRVTGDDILKHRDGLSFHGPLFWWLRATGLFSRERGLRGDSFMRDQTRDFADTQISTARAFAWIVTPSNDRRAQLMAGAAFVRANLQATLLGLAMQPLSQALQEYKEMVPVYAEMKRALGVAESETLQMFFRLGRASPGEPSPRRSSSRNPA